MNALAELRELHQPNGDGYGYRLTCEGCDYGGYEAESPEWPCRTAELVYSADEITDTVTTYESWRNWMRDVEMRRKKATAITPMEEIGTALLRSLFKRSPITALMAQAPTEVGPVKYTIPIPVSTQMLETGGSA